MRILRQITSASARLFRGSKLRDAARAYSARPRTQRCIQSPSSPGACLEMLLPTRIGPLVTPLLAHTGQPDRSSRRPHTHTRLLFLKPCAMLTIMGPPWTLHPRTSTVLAHDPMLGPRFRISHPSCAAAPHSNAGTIHPGSSQHLSAQRPRSTLLCTAHLPGLLMQLSASPHCTSLGARSSSLSSA